LVLRFVAGNSETEKAPCGAFVFGVGRWN